MISCTRARAASLTRRSSLTTRETVDRETPARRAISSRFTGPPTNGGRGERRQIRRRAKLIVGALPQVSPSVTPFSLLSSVIRKTRERRGSSRDLYVLALSGVATVACCSTNTGRTHFYSYSYWSSRGLLLSGVKSINKCRFPFLASLDRLLNHWQLNQNADDGGVSGIEAVRSAYQDVGGYHHSSPLSRIACIRSGRWWNHRAFRRGRI